MARARTLVTGLAALAALASAVIGLPVVLYQFAGSPLPRHIASWRQVASVLARQNDGTTLLLAVVRDCSWLAWLLFTSCVLAEAQAAIFHRRAPHLHTAGIQGVAARLVALAMVTFTAPPAITLSAAVTAVTTVSRQPAARPASELLAAADSVDKAVRTVTVRSGDCLWSMAQRYLGAGDRYPEITRLNYGHDMGDGQVFMNPALIEPGWQLLVPANARASQPAASQQAATRASGSQHAGHATNDPYYRRRHPSARNPVARQHAAVDHADSSRNRNGVIDRNRSSPARAIAGRSPDADTRPAGDEVRDQPTPIADPASSQLPQAAVFVAGALAGAVLTSLTLLRWRQRQDRRRGRRIPLPPERSVLAAEQRIRAAGPAENARLETLRDALASLEAGLVSAGQMLPEIVGLHVTPDVLEVLLAAPAPDAPPAPYCISPGRQGMCWELELPATAALSRDPGAVPVRRAAGQACHLLPGLVTVGATGAGYLLLDLEELQVTGCDGAPGLVDRVVSTTATELATGQWSGWYELVLVGFDELDVLGRASHCGSLDEALSLIEARCAVTGPRIDARAPADVRELRLAEPDNEDWNLTVLISRIEPTPVQLLRLLKLAEDGPGGIAALVAGDPEAPDGRMAPAVLQLAPDPQAPDGIVANVAPLQITVRPRALSAADYDAIATLFAVAAEQRDVGAVDEPYAAYAAPPWLQQFPHQQTAEDPLAQTAAVVSMAADPALQDAGKPFARNDAAELAALPDSRQEPQPCSSPDESLRVRVLGPFVITGAAGQLQPKQAELVLALALAAPAGLSNSALCSILGADPDHPKPTDAVRQIIARTRRRLGPAPDGQEYIIHAGNGHYLLHPHVLLDWTEFRELAESGKVAGLREAVSLIAGQPFTGSYFWWIDMPLIETVRADVVDAAEKLAELELAGGAPRAAAKAARTGLLAEPAAEQLWRVLMRAEHGAGNMAGVAEVWRRCLDAIEDIAPAGEPHPDTAVLYRQLAGQARHYVPAR